MTQSTRGLKAPKTFFHVRPADLTVREFAEKLGVNYVHVYSLERGLSGASIQLLKKYSLLTGKKVSEIVAMAEDLGEL